MDCLVSGVSDTSRLKGGCLDNECRKLPKARSSPNPIKDNIPDLNEQKI